MSKAKKLPSGSWRCQAQYTDEYGVLHRASLTEDTARLAEAKAAMWKAGMLELDEERKDPPLGQAIDEYIETCRATNLSPTTIRGYISLRETAYTTLIQKRISRITLRDIQQWVNAGARHASPKTVRNRLGLLQAVMKANACSVDFTQLRLPKPQRSEMEIPSDAQVSALLQAVYDDDDMFLAIAFAALMGLRRSEACGLKWADVVVRKGQPMLRVDKALVMGEGGVHVEKAPKTCAGTRELPIPAALHEELKHRRGLRTNIISLTPNALSLKYTRLAKELGVPPRFHNLRHYHASVMLREGVPEKYIIADMGHSSFDMVKRVYGHIMSERQGAIHAAMCSHASAVLNPHTAAHTESEKSSYC